MPSATIVKSWQTATEAFLAARVDEGELDANGNPASTEYIVSCSLVKEVKETIKSKGKDGKAVETTRAVPRTAAELKAELTAALKAACLPKQQEREAREAAQASETALPGFTEAEEIAI